MLKYKYDLEVLENDPPAGTEGAVREIKSYDPALDIRYVPSLGCWALFRLTPTSYIRRFRFEINGNGIDPEYVYCFNILSWYKISERIRRSDPTKIRSIKNYLRAKRIEQRYKRDRLREYCRKEMRYTTRENKEYLKKRFEPLLRNNNPVVNMLNK